jgi:hypothetical protein
MALKRMMCRSHNEVGATNTTAIDAHNEQRGTW